MDAFVDGFEHLITAPLHGPFIVERADMYSNAVEEKTSDLNYCIGFTDRTCIFYSKVW